MKMSHAKLLNNAARAHWGIDNCVHWRLDVVFNEEACIRNDNAAENIDILRKWALNALTQCKKNQNNQLKV